MNVLGDAVQARAHSLMLVPTHANVNSTNTNTISTTNTINATNTSNTTNGLLRLVNEALLRHELRLQLHDTAAKRQEEYVASCVSVKDVENYDGHWLQQEQRGQDHDSKHNEQLDQTFNDFLDDDRARVLLLLGDGGTGKSLSLHQLAHDQLAKLEHKPGHSEASVLAGH
jgi:hypothetical protein